MLVRLASRARRGPVAFLPSACRSIANINDVMATPGCWDNVAVAGYDDALFGHLCGAFAAQMVKRHSGPHAKLLDVGTGTGAVALGLAEKYPDAEVMTSDLCGCHCMLSRSCRWLRLFWFLYGCSVCVCVCAGRDSHSYNAAHTSRSFAMITSCPPLPSD